MSAPSTVSDRHARQASADVQSLTVLRGLAAYAVVLTHCLRLLESCGAAAPAWLRWLDIGNFAVIVFFALSGFTLVLAHRRDRWDGSGVRRFLTRRLFRVYPGFLASFALCLAVVLGLQGAHGLPPGTWIGDSHRVPDAAAALAYLSFTSNLFGIEGYVNNVFWSLPIEFQFYLLFPAFMLLMQRSAAAALGATAALAVAGRVLHWPGQTADLAWVFVAGMAAGRAFLAGRRLWPAMVRLCVIVAALVLACLLSNAPVAALRRLPGPLSLYVGVLALAVVWCVAQTGVGPGPHRRWLRALVTQGEISYSVYLLHTPPILLAYWAIQHWDLHGGVAVTLVYGLVLPGTWAAAHLVHSAVERPGIALGRRLSRGRPAG